MRTIVAVDPSRCRIWRMHDRRAGEIEAQSCATEIKSIAAHGQLVPALGRRVTDDPNIDVELIYGARRLFVARYLHKPLLVELREISDREALIAMDAENRLRKDISGYERGLSYAQWLRSGQFASQEELAHAINVSPSQVSRLIRLTQLPAVIIGAFRTPDEIRENWALELLALLDDPIRRNSIISAARTIASTERRPTARAVYRRLLRSSARGRKTESPDRDRVVQDPHGVPLFRVRQQGNSVAFILPYNVRENSIERIESMLMTMLQFDGRFVNPPRTRPVDVGQITPTSTLDLSAY